MITFSHGGKLGDLLYSLPAVKRMGGGDLVLHPYPHTGMTMTPADVENIRPLLERQPYIRSLRFAEHPVGLNMDGMRNHWGHGLNVADMYCRWLGLPFPDRLEPWLEGVEPNRVSRVVIARSPRYHGDGFPWRRVVEKYGREAVFVGHREEHEAFVGQFGSVPYLPTADLYQLARVLQGAELVVSSQTCARAIAEGLKRPTVTECPFNNDNCHYDRPGCVYGYRSDTVLPELPSRKQAALTDLVPFRQFTEADRAAQVEHLEDWHHLYRPGQHRYICSVLGAVHEQLGERPDLQELLLEAVWMARRMDDAGRKQEDISWK